MRICYANFMRSLICSFALLLLTGCQASPLYTGAGGARPTVHPGPVPRDGNGEPILNLPQAR
jgi:hypothetical protein